MKCLVIFLNLEKIHIVMSQKFFVSSGAPNVDFQKISVRKTIWDLEFSEHLL